MNWYLVQTKPNAHFLASKNLMLQNFEVFLPLVSATSQKLGRFFNNTIPLFPSYLFIGSNSNQISWKSVNSTRGVSKVITLDGKYRSINEKIIEALRSRCDANGIVQPELNISVGDQVKIESGPLTNFICKVEKISESKRVWVLLELMQQKTRVTVSINDLTKLT